MKFRVEVMPKEEVLDPQGVAVEKALKMQFTDVAKVALVSRSTSKCPVPTPLPVHGLK